MSNLHDQVGELWQMLGRFEWSRWKYWVTIIVGTALVTWGIWSGHVDHTDPNSFPRIFMGLMFWYFAYVGQILDRIARKFRKLRDSLAQTDIYVEELKQGEKGV